MEHWVVKFNNLSFNMDTLITMWLSMILLIVAAFLATRNLSIVPNKIQYVLESVIKYFLDITKSSMGEKAAKQHLPLILTLFMFILTIFLKLEFVVNELYNNACPVSFATINF